MGKDGRSRVDDKMDEQDSDGEWETVDTPLHETVEDEKEKVGAGSKNKQPWVDLADDKQTQDEENVELPADPGGDFFSFSAPDSEQLLKQSYHNPSSTSFWGEEEDDGLIYKAIKANVLVPRMNTVGKDLEEEFSNLKEFANYLANPQNRDKFLEKCKAGSLLKSQIDEVMSQGVQKVFNDFPSKFKNVTWTAGESIIKNDDGETVATVHQTVYNLQPENRLKVYSGEKWVEVTQYRELTIPTTVEKGGVDLFFCVQDVNGNPMSPTNERIYSIPHYKDGKLIGLTESMPITYHGKGDEAMGFIEYKGICYCTGITKGHREKLLKVIEQNGHAVANVSQVIEQEVQSADIASVKQHSSTSPIVSSPSEKEEALVKALKDGIANMTEENKGEMLKQVLNMESNVLGTQQEQVIHNLSRNSKVLSDGTSPIRLKSEREAVMKGEKEGNPSYSPNIQTGGIKSPKEINAVGNEVVTKYAQSQNKSPVIAGTQIDDVKGSDPTLEKSAITEGKTSNVASPEDTEFYVSKMRVNLQKSSPIFDKAPSPQQTAKQVYSELKNKTLEQQKNIIDTAFEGLYGVSGERVIKEVMEHLTENKEKDSLPHFVKLQQCLRNKLDKLPTQPLPKPPSQQKRNSNTAGIGQ